MAKVNRTVLQLPETNNELQVKEWHLSFDSQLATRQIDNSIYISLRQQYLDLMRNAWLQVLITMKLWP